MCQRELSIIPRVEDGIPTLVLNGVSVGLRQKTLVRSPNPVEKQERIPTVEFFSLRTRKFRIQIAIHPSEKTTFPGEPLFVKPQSPRVFTRDRWNGWFGKGQLTTGDQTQVGKVVIGVPHNRVVRSPQQTIRAKGFNR